MHKLNPTIALALFVATIPSLWAVAAPFVGVTVGAAALITGGFFVASGNDPKNKWRELFGMWLGIPWGMMAVTFPGLTGWPKTTLFVTLFVLGALAVLISGMPGIRNWVDTAAWLTGWAISIIILSLKGGPAKFGTMPLQIAGAMLAGIFIVGVLGRIIVDALSKQN